MLFAVLQTRDVLHAAILQGHLDATRWHGVAIGHTFLLEDPVTWKCANMFQHSEWNIFADIEWYWCNFQIMMQWYNMYMQSNGTKTRFLRVANTWEDLLRTSAELLNDAAIHPGAHWAAEDQHCAARAQVGTFQGRTWKNNKNIWVIWIIWTTKICITFADENCAWFREPVSTSQMSASDPKRWRHWRRKTVRCSLCFLRVDVSALPCFPGREGTSLPRHGEGRNEMRWNSMNSSGLNKLG